ncbi:MAG: hypothetical protein ACT4OU_13035 [Hyphomicrobium sp.]
MNAYRKQAPVYDPELQLRFLRSATDAFFEGAEAFLAASQAWQNAFQPSPDIQRSRSAAPMPLEPFAAWSWAFDLMRESPAVRPAMSATWPWLGAAPAKPTWPMQAFQMNPAWAMNPGAAPFASAATLSADPASLWSSMMTSYWTLPAVSWSLYQGPLMMMLVGSGLPYAIAAPTARASTAALDAADAVRLQTINAFSSFRTDGGHASSLYGTAAPTDRAAQRAAIRRNAH